jgi:hypothetical protein
MRIAHFPNRFPTTTPEKPNLDGEVMNSTTHVERLKKVAVAAIAATVLSTNVAYSQAAATQPEARRMWMTIGDHRFAVTLADTATALSFAALLPLNVEMSDLNGNEKHSRLPKSLPVNASRPGTLRTGDIMLYGSDTLVVFYLTFDSPYSYTRIGRVDDPGALQQASGPADVRVTFSRD